MVHFASEASRWLGIWLDPTLVLVENRGRRIGRMRQAEARLRRIASTYVVPPRPPGVFRWPWRRAPFSTPPSSPGMEG